MECKRIKATFGKAGGTAAKNNQVVRIVIPADWVRKMKLTKENAYLEAEFERLVEEGIIDHDGNLRNDSEMEM